MLGIRVPVKVYFLYEALDLDREDLAEFKQLVSSFIVSKAIEKGIDVPEEIKEAFQGVLTKSVQGNNIIFNISISKAEAKAEAHVNIDINDIIKKLDEIQQYLTTLYKVSPNPASVTIPKNKFSEIMDQLDDIKRRLVN